MSDLRYRLHKMAVHQESVWGLTGVSDLLREADTYVGALESKVKGLEGSVALWNETGDAIMEVAVGRRAPLSDSEVTSVIEVLRTRVTELTDAIDVMRQNADSDRAYISSLEKDASNVLNRFLNQVSELKGERDLLKAEWENAQQVVRNLLDFYPARVTKLEGALRGLISLIRMNEEQNAVFEKGTCRTPCWVDRRLDDARNILNDG